MEISEALKDGYFYAFTNHATTNERCLALALRDALARAIKAEHWISHDIQIYRGRFHPFCEPCKKTDWQAEAHRMLMGEK